MILKGCPRCGGDMFPEDDDRDQSLACLQCGHRLALKLVSRMATPAASAH